MDTAAVNGLDVVIAVLVVSAALGGYRLGFVARVVSWVLTGVGGYLALRSLPGLVRRADDPSGRVDLLVVAAAVLVAGAVVGQVVGLAVGNRINLAIHSRVARRTDALAGAAAGAVGVLAGVWLLVPAMADVPGVAARLARTSAVVQVFDRSLPEAPDATRALRRMLGEDAPEVFDRLRPAPEVGPVPGGAVLDQATAVRAAASTVKVTGEACDRIQEGSGVVVGDDLAVTNAHVVAGDELIEVERFDGRRLPARLVAFDPRADLAVLAVPGLGRPALPLAEPEVGQRGEVFGHPGGGPLERSPFSVDRRRRIVGTDIYDRRRVEREVLFLASALAPGDSGAALVSPTGEVVGLAFAIAPDQPGVAYALTATEVGFAVEAVRPEGVSSGPCTG